MIDNLPSIWKDAVKTRRSDGICKVGVYYLIISKTDNVYELKQTFPYKQFDCGGWVWTFRSRSKVRKFKADSLDITLSGQTVLIGHWIK